MTIRILHINALSVGGAAKACIRLHETLSLTGIESVVLFKAKKIDVANSFEIEEKNNIIGKWIPRVQNKLVRLLCKFLTFLRSWKKSKQINFLGYDYYSFPFSEYYITRSHLYEQADIIHLHWVADFLDWRTFFKNNKKPIVWTLHDINPFSGGKHVFEKYFGINDKGEVNARCPTDYELCLENKLTTIKSKALKGIKRLYVACPSQWILNQSKSSKSLGGFPHFHIPNGFSTDIFTVIDKEHCRKQLGISMNKKVLLFVADSLDRPIKGFRLLQEALNHIQLVGNHEYFLLVVGKKSHITIDIETLFLGEIVDERLLAVAYNAADVFVIPSIEDNFPNTMVESLLCGTPVVGFPVGGIPEAVISGENGLLCDTLSVESLAKTVLHFFENNQHIDRIQISENARMKYNLATFASNYQRLYKEIISKM